MVMRRQKWYTTAGKISRFADKIEKGFGLHKPRTHEFCDNNLIAVKPNYSPPFSHDTYFEIAKIFSSPNPLLYPIMSISEYNKSGETGFRGDIRISRCNGESYMLDVVGKVLESDEGLDSDKGWIYQHGSDKRWYPFHNQKYAPVEEEELLELLGGIDEGFLENLEPIVRQQYVIDQGEKEIDSHQGELYGLIGYDGPREVAKVLMTQDNIILIPVEGEKLKDPRKNFPDVGNPRRYRIGTNEMENLLGILAENKLPVPMPVRELFYNVS